MEEGVSFIATPSGRAMAYYVSYAKRHEEELAKLEAARDNLIRTITFATQMKDLDAVHGLWESLGDWLWSTGDWATLRQLEDWALQANWELQRSGTDRSAQLALILRDRSDLLDTVGDQIGALDDATEACQLAERSGDPKAMIAALVGMASLLARNPDKTNEQRSLLETAWRLCRKTPGWHERAFVAYQRGHSFWQDDPGRAVEWFRRCIQVARRSTTSSLASLRYESYGCQSLGDLFAERGDFTQAHKYLEAARRLKVKLGDRYSIAIVLRGLADLQLRMPDGDISQAISWLTEAEKTFRGVGAVSWLPRTCRSLGLAFVAQGEQEAEGAYPQALAAYRQALDLTDAEADPRFYGVILHDIAEVHRALGELDEAARLYREAADHKQRGGSSARDQAITVRALGLTFEEQGEQEAEGAYPQALAAYRQALDLTDAEADPRFYGVILHDIADVHRALGELDEAARLYREAADHKQRGQASPADQARTLLALGEAQQDLGRSGDALHAGTEAAQLLRASPEAGTHLLAEVLVFMARIQIQSDPGQAVPLLEEAGQLLAPDNVTQALERVTVLGLLTAAYRALGRQDEAQQAAAEADSILAVRTEDILAGENIGTLLTLSQILIEQEDLEQAGAVLYRAGAVLQAGPPAATAAAGPDLARTLLALGRAFQRGRDYPQALAAYRQALDLTDAEADPRFYGVILHDIAEVHRALGELDEAARLYREAADHKQRGGSSARDQAVTVLALGRAFEEQGEQEAEGAYPQALAAYRQALVLTDAEADPRFYGVILHDIADVHRALGELDEAARLYREAADHKQRGGSSARDQAITVRALGLAFEEQGEQEAEGAYPQALAAYRQALDLTDAEADPRFYGVILHDIADVHRALGELDEAARLYREAADHKQRGQASPADQAETLLALGEAQQDLGRSGDALHAGTEAAQLLRASPEAGTHLLAEVLVFMARIQIQSDPGQAVPLLEEAGQLLAPNNVTQALERVTVLGLLTAAYRALGRQDEAQQAAAEADSILAVRTEDILAGENIGTLLTLSQILIEQEDLEQAGAVLYRAGAVLQAGPPAATAAAGPDLARTLLALGRAFQRGRDYPQALAAYRQALDLTDAEADPRFYGVILHDIAEVHRALGELDEAARLYREAADHKQRGGSSARDQAVTVRALGRAFEEQGEQEAEGAYPQALAAYRQALDLTDAEADPRFYGVILHDIADVHRALGELDEAARLYREAADHKQRGQASPADQARTLLALGRTFQRGRDYPQALAAYRQALVLTDAEADPRFYGVILHDIAEVHRALGELDEAARLYREAADHKQRGGSSARDQAVTVRALGLAFVAQGEQEAEGAYPQALAAYRQALVLTDAEADPRFYGVILHDIAEVHRALGELDEAARLYREAADHKQRGGSSARDQAVTVRALGRAFEEQGEQEAEGAYPQALAAYRQALVLTDAEADPRFYGVILHDIAEVHRALGELDEAARLYREAADHKQRGGSSARDQAITVRALGLAFEEQGEQEAEGAYPQALAAYRQALDLTDAEADPRFYGVILHDIADVHRALGELDEAARLYREAADHKQRGQASPADQARTLLALGEAQQDLGRSGDALHAGTEAAQLLRASPEAGTHLLAEVLVFMARIQIQSDPGQAVPLLEEAGQLLAPDNVTQALERVTVLGLLTAAYRALGRQDEAQQAAAEADSILAVRTEDILAGENIGTLLTLSQILIEQEDLEQAGAVLYRAGAVLQAGPPAATAAAGPDLARTLLALGRAFQRGRDYPQALAAYRQALDLTDAEADPRFYGVILHDIAEVHRALGELDEAARLYREAADRKQRGGSSARDQAVTVRALGRAFEEQGEQEAEGAYPQALAAYRQALDLTDAEADPRFYGVILHDIADVHRALGELDEAARLYREAADHKQRGQASPADQARTLLALGRTFQRGRDYPQALAAYRQALVLTDAEADPRFYGVILHDIAEVHRALGELDEAARLYREAADHKQRGGSSARDQAITVRALGLTFEEQGEREAEGAYPQALAAYRQALDLTDAEADPRFYGVILHDIADVHRALGELDEAARLYREAADHKQRGQASPADQARTLLALGEAQQDLGRSGDALHAGTEAAQLLRASPEAGTHLLAEVLVFMARIQIQSDPGQAVPLLEEAGQLLAPDNVTQALERVTVLGLLTAAYRALGRQDEAQQAAAEADSILAGSKASFNISWPLNDDESSIASASNEIRAGRIYIILNPGANGLTFNKRLVRFSEGPRYKSLDITQRRELPNRRRRDHRPLVISLPYLEGAIEKVSYAVDDNIFTLIVVPASPDVKFQPGDVEFSRQLPPDYAAAVGDLLAATAEDILADENIARLLALGGALIEHQELERAVTAIERAKVMLQSKPPAEASAALPALTEVTHNLGRAFERGRDYPQALAAYRQALDLTDAEADPRFYGVILHDIADVHRALGELDEAARLYREAADHKQRGGSSARDQAITVRALGLTFEEQGEREAEGAYPQALAAYRQALDLTDAEADPRFYGVILHDIADVHRALGELDEAARLYREAADHKQRGQASPADQARTLLALGEAQQDLGRSGDALHAGTEAAQLLRASPEAGTHLLAEVLVFMARIQIQSDPGQAVPLLEEAGQLLAPDNVTQALERVTVLGLLTAAYRALGRQDEAQQAAAEADSILAGSKASFNISWPLNDDESSIASASNEIRAGRIYIILNPGANGLTFNKRLVRFSEGPRYKSLDITQRRELPNRRRRDHRPLVISLPYLEGAIEKVSYAVDDNIFTLIVVPASPDVKFQPGDVEFSRQLPPDYAAAVGDLLAATAEDILADENIARLLALGGALIEHQELERAVTAIERAKVMLQSKPPAEASAALPALTEVTHNLGRAFERGRDYPQALAAYRQALDLTDAEADPRFYGVILHDIADVHRALGELDEAARLYREAADHKQRGQASPADQADTLLALGEAQQDLGRSGDALHAGTEAAQLLRASPEAGTHLLAEVLVFMARIQIQSDPGQAVPLLEEAGQLLAPNNVTQALERVTVLGLLTAAYRALGRQDEAQQAAAEADSILAGSKASFNISWPLNDDESSIASASNEIRAGRIYIILNPGANGLTFNKRLVRFSEGPRYKSLDITQRRELPNRRRRDHRPLVISLPYLEGAIEKVSYAVDDNIFTLIVVPASPDVKFQPGDVEFSRQLPQTLAKVGAFRSGTYLVPTRVAVRHTGIRQSRGSCLARTYVPIRSVESPQFKRLL